VTADTMTEQVSAGEARTRGPANFARQARGLGLNNVVHNGDEWVYFDLVIPAGSHQGETVRIAAAVPPDFPDNPPAGPNISPPYTHPAGGVHASPLGGDYMYWSRPVQQWQADRSVRAWVRHVRSLFGQT
jgi:hypothetical protein